MSITRVRLLFHLITFFLSTQLETWQMYKAVQNLTHYNTRNSVTAEGDAVLDDEHVSR